MTTTEQQIELDLIAKLGDLKYTYRPDIRDRAALEANFREKFEALNRVSLTDNEFQRLLDSIITSDIFSAAQRLRNKRIVFIFDECHRSQFGENHKAIKNFFPNAQLFGFTGTPIFEQNASYQQIEGQQASYRTTNDLFQHCLHQYTITHAIEYHALFKEEQNARSAHDPDFVPLNIACVFSPPAEGNKDVQQIQEDLPQEKADNQQDPEGKKAALTRIIADYNTQYGTNHHFGEFDLYYQDVQKRIKDQQYPNADLPHTQKIDITIVVDMLLTGFDARYLNTLYVDKNLKHHGLIQSDAKFIDESDDITEYIRSLDVGTKMEEMEIREGYERFKAEKKARELSAIAGKYGLDSAALQIFVDDVLRRSIFDGERLSNPMAPLGLGWRERTRSEQALVNNLTPLLHKLARGREISGLGVYEQ